MYTHSFIDKTNIYIYIYNAIITDKLHYYLLIIGPLHLIAIITCDFDERGSVHRFDKSPDIKGKCAGYELLGLGAHN